MSEMKPWGYIHHSATQTLRDRAMCNSTITKKATANSDMPLYTAERLAEAVAAERERCAKVCEKQRDDYADPAYAGGPIGALCERIACKTCAEAIRSAAK